MKELNDILFRGKVSDLGMRRMNEVGLLPSVENIKDWKQSFIGCFLLKNYKYYGIILTIEKIIGKRPDWKDFTKQNIRDIAGYYLNECAQSSARTYLALIRLVLNDHDEKHEIPCRTFADELSVKNTPSISIYLNVEDIKKLEGYTPVNDRERIVLSQFLCGCYTGARHSDILAMTEDNIHGKYVSYISKKTKRKSTIELKKGLRRLLQIAKEHVYSDYIFNDTIRDICKKVGINDKVRVFKAGKYVDGEKWNFVSSHTARRSFASNLADMRVPVREISIRMGHSNTAMTERYILSGISELPETAMEYFK